MKLRLTRWLSGRELESGKTSNRRLLLIWFLSKWREARVLGTVFLVGGNSIVKILKHRQTWHGWGTEGKVPRVECGDWIKTLICQRGKQRKDSCRSVAKSLSPCGLQRAGFPGPSVSPGAYSNSCPLSQWCHPTTSTSVTPFSCPQRP